MKEKIIKLEPIKDTPEDWTKVEEAIKEHFRKELYLPLMRALGINKFENAEKDLLRSLQSGFVRYANGEFTVRGGTYGADISRALKELGAVFDKSSRTFKLDGRKVPLEVKNAMSAGLYKFKEKLKIVDAALAQTSPAEIAGKIKLSKFFDTTLWKTQRGFEKTVKGITIAPKLTKEMAARIAEGWELNLRKYIQDFTAEQIVKMRAEIKKPIFAGVRFDDVEKIILGSYTQSKNKAKFLAKQETNLLMAKYKESRYLDAGVEEYEWGCVHRAHDSNPKQHTPGNVRFYHGILEGKIFKFSEPPITNAQGKRNNPGEDYNCRCFARPIVRVRK